MLQVVSQQRSVAGLACGQRLRLQRMAACLGKGAPGDHAYVRRGVEGRDEATRGGTAAGSATSATAAAAAAAAAAVAVLMAAIRGCSRLELAPLQQRRERRRRSRGARARMRGVGRRTARHPESASASVLSWLSGGQRLSQLTARGHLRTPVPSWSLLPRREHDPDLVR